MSIDNATPAEWDMVNKPKHYTTEGIECIDYIKQQLNEDFPSFCEGNVIKYLHRWRYKGGTEDLRKARWYLDKMLEEVIV